jgi:hypothetical protein
MVYQEPVNDPLWQRHQSMKRWLRLGLQLISLVLFGLVLVWGWPEAWQHVSASDLEYILVSLPFLGFASMISAVRLQLIARSSTGRELASWPRFYYLNITTHALELVGPRTLSTLGAKSVGLGILGFSRRRAVWVMMPAKAFVIAQRAYIFIFVLVWAGFSVLLSLALGGSKHA